MGRHQRRDEFAQASNGALFGRSRLDDDGGATSSDGQPWALAQALDGVDMSTPGLVPHSALRGDAALRLRAAYNEKELELMELREEHAQLAARFAEAQGNMEEALEVKDRTIDKLAAALEAREEALERQGGAAASLHEVHTRILALQARTAEVEAQAEKRAASAQRYKQEVRRLRAELLQAQAAAAAQRAAADAVERRVAAALSAHRAEAEQAALQAATALAAQRAETEAALQRAAAAEAARAAEAAAAESLRDELEEAHRRLAALEPILRRLAQAGVAV